MAIDADPELNPFLSGNYAPVRDELDVADLRVTGHIPEALRGGYLRNGANPAFAPLGRYHIFDGDGMVHAVELADGRARYRNRWVESKGLLAERREGHALFGGLSEYITPDPELVAEVGLLKNTANTNVIRHAGRYLALMEAAPPTEITRDLRTIGETDFDGRLPGAMTAHPKWDPASGELLFFGYSPLPPYLRYHVLDAQGTLTRTEEIEIPRPVMMHDFVATEHHVVFFDLPAVFDIAAMLGGGSMVSWQPEHGSRIGVMPRDGGNDDVTWFELDPFFAFHFLNGWDADEHTVVVDGCRSSAIPTSFGDEVLTEPIRPTLHRWTMDLDSGEVRTEQLDDRWADFPRLAMDRSGVPNRYGYLAHSTSWETDAVQFTGVVKVDLETGEALEHRYGPDCEGGEPVFAPDPDGTAEDDGWLLNMVFDRATGESSLVITDARDMEGEPVARVHLPRRVPTGFHGNWMPDAS